MSSFVASVSATVASTRGLKRMSFAIPLSSSEISTFVKTATHKAVKNPRRAITAVSVIGYKFLTKHTTKHSAIFVDTIRETIHDVVIGLQGVTAEFSMSKWTLRSVL